MLYSDEHMDCCGITHIYNFAPYGNSADNFIKEMQKIFDEQKDPEEGCPSGLFTVVLTDQQMDQETNLGKKAVECLKKFRFVRVDRFYNFDSGNYCNVFHKKYGQPNPLKAPKPKY